VGQEQLTRSGLVTGTPAYFAPELARGEEPSPASDVWALGVSLYLAVEGHPPYAEQGNALAVLNTIAHEPAPRPTRAGALTGPLRRMLDPDPARRATMQEAAAALRAAATAPPPAPESAAPPAPCRGVPVLALALLALVAAVAVGGWWLVRDTGDDQPAATAPAPQGSAPTRRPSRTPEPEPSPSEEPPTSASTPPADGTDAAGLVSDYYAKLPDDTDDGWSMLSPGMQEQIGRGTYDGFWATIDAVSVDDVSADGDVVSVALTYTTDGRSEHETRRLTVEDGLITADSGPV
jgi:eukaryotic-like serine/threonine-protein kinase